MTRAPDKSEKKIFIKTSVDKDLISTVRRLIY
jgi:hypothetical protein